MSFYAADAAAAAAAEHATPQPQPPPDWNSLANFVFSPSPAAARAPPPPPPPPPQHHFSPANAAANPLLLHARAPPQPHPSQLAAQSPAVHHPATVARSLASIAGTNAKLPPEAFALAENYHPSHDDLLSRNKNVLFVRKPAHHVSILLKFNQQLQSATPSHSLIKFWKPLFAAHFAEQAAFHIDLKSADTHTTRPFKLPVELMASLWKCKYDSGMTTERILLDSPIEHAYSDDSVVVDCPNTLIISNYPRSAVLTDGHLRVWFNASDKIFRWEFSARAHQELFAASAFNPSGPPHSHCSEYGIPRNLLELMLYAEVINKLHDKIDAEVSQIVSQAANNAAPLAVPNPVSSAVASNPVASGTANVPSNTASASHLNQPALAAEVTNNDQSTGNAYRAMLSGLGGSQALPLDHALSAKQVQMPSASTLTPNNRTDAARSLLAHSISPDEMAVNAIGTALNWRDEQSQPLQNPELLKNLLEETIRSSLEADNSNARPSTQRRTGTATDHLTRQIAELSEAQERRRPPSAIDAVAAAASGQGGWGVDISASAKQSFSEALDARMSLQTAVGNATLSMGGVSAPKTAPMQHAANAGLGLFQTQAAVTDGRKSRATAGGRGNRSGVNMRGAGNSVYREFSDVEVLKRMSSAKVKREQKADARLNGSLGMNGSAGAGLASGSQGSYSHLSGEIGSKHANDESSVVIGHGGSGRMSGKKSRRSSTADGREKRQKVVNGGAV